MLLTITLTEPPATDLGFLLHKHPDRLQSFAVSAGEAHVFYPEAAGRRCTVALLLEIDPVGLVRGAGGPGRAAAARRRSLSPNTSTTGPTRPRRCWRSRWARFSGPR